MKDWACFLGQIDYFGRIWSFNAPEMNFETSFCMQDSGIEHHEQGFHFVCLTLTRKFLQFEWKNEWKRVWTAKFSCILVWKVVNARYFSYFNDVAWKIPFCSPFLFHGDLMNLEWTCFLCFLVHVLRIFCILKWFSPFIDLIQPQSRHLWTFC